MELPLKHQKKTYDFKDFAKAVRAANIGNVHLKKMSYSDFYQWIDNKAQQKPLKSTNRVLLRDIVSIKAECRKYFKLVIKLSSMIKHTQH